VAAAGVHVQYVLINIKLLLQCCTKIPIDFKAFSLYNFCNLYNRCDLLAHFYTNVTLIRRPLPPHPSICRPLTP